MVGLLSKKSQTAFLSYFKTLPSAHEIQRSAFDFIFLVTFGPILNLMLQNDPQNKIDIV